MVLREIQVWSFKGGKSDSIIYEMRVVTSTGRVRKSL